MKTSKSVAPVAFIELVLSCLSGFLQCAHKAQPTPPMAVSPVVLPHYLAQTAQLHVTLATEA